MSTPGAPGFARPNTTLVWLSLALVAVLALTCASGHRPLAPQAASSTSPLAAGVPKPTEEASPPPGQQPISVSKLALRAANGPLEHSESGSALVALPHFFQALRELETKRRNRPVRLAWLGDSHTAADFWTDEVRAQLQARFGNAGPGFFHLGLKAYRHSSLRFEQTGSWSREPSPPSLRSRSGDGVFGLGGIRTFAHSAGARFEVSPEPNLMLESANWRVRLRLAPTDAVELEAGEERYILRGTPRDEVQEQVLAGRPSVSLKVRVVNGTPRFLGGALEASAPGVILDTLGVDGARVETALAWEEAAWKRELVEREPSLLVLAYGTNEVFDNLAPRAYAEQYARLVQRARAASPALDCLIIGLPDALTPEGQPHPRVPEIGKVQEEAAERLGCAFFDARAAMQREGGFLGWLAANPKLAKTDGIHLTISGYHLLGARTAEALLAGYEQFLNAREAR